MKKYKNNIKLVRVAESGAVGYIQYQENYCLNPTVYSAELKRGTLRYESPDTFGSNWLQDK